MKKVFVSAMLALVLAIVSVSFPADALVGGSFVRNQIKASAETSVDYEYEIVADGIIITKYTGDDVDLKIPSTIDNKVVSGIGTGAFADCVNLKSITIPEMISIIGDNAIGYVYNNDTNVYEKTLDFKIYCYSGTQGEKYAGENGINYELITKIGEVTGLTAESVVNTVKISWNKLSNAEGYIIYNFDDSVKDWVEVGKTSEYNYTVKNLSSGSSYKFAVKAYKTVNGEEITSESYSVVSATTSLGTITGVKPAPTSNTVKLSWSKLSNAEGYIVYKYDDAVKDWVEVGKTREYNYTIKNLSSGSSYKFAVKAYKTVNGEEITSESYSVVSATTSLGTVTGVKSTPTSNTVKLTWNKTSNAQGYLVYRYDNAKKSWVRVAKTTGNNYTLKSLSTGTEYKFYVKAYKNVNGKEIISQSYITVSAITKLSTVTGLKSESSGSSAKLSWKKVSNAHGYIIYRYDSTKKSWTRVAKTKTTATSYTVKKLSSSKTYKFSVRAYKTVNGKETLSSSYPTVTALKSPAKVKTISATVDKDKITIKWSKVANATGYQIYYASSKTGKSVLLKEITSGKTTSYSTKALPKGKNYYIRVRAISKTTNSKTTGQYSSWIKKRVFANKSFNSAMKSYKNTKTIKTVNAHGYKVSSKKQKQLINALTYQNNSAGFLMYDLESGAVVAYNANTYFGTASTVKLPYMLYALKEMEDGKPNFKTKVTYQSRDKHGGSGVIQNAKIGTKYTIQHLFTNIMKYSDNVAYYMLQRTFPYKGYNKYIASLGCKTSITSYRRWGVVSAADSTRHMIEMNKYLKTGKYASFMKDKLSKVVAGYFREGLNNKYTVYSKSGWTGTNVNDTAIVQAEHPYILVCFTYKTRSVKLSKVAKAADAIHDEMWSYYNK